MYRDRAIAIGRRECFFLSFAGDIVKILPVSFSPSPLQTEICEAAPLVEKLGRLIGQSPQPSLARARHSASVARNMPKKKI